MAARTGAAAKSTAATTSAAAKSSEATSAEAKAAAPKKTRRRRVKPAETVNSRAADAKVASLAAQQHGLISRPQAIACGMSSTSVKARVRRGRWQKLFRGVYALAGSPPSREREIMAACLAVGPDAVATSFTAAELHRLPKIYRRELPILAATHANKVRCPKRKLDELRKQLAEQKRWAERKKLPAPPFTLGHRRSLDRPGARAVQNGIPVASVAWTYVELAAHLPENTLELSIAEAMRRHLVTTDELAEAVALAGDGAHVVKLRRILAGDVLNEAFRSLGEIILKQQLRDEGYADTIMNKEFPGPNHVRIGEPDAQCPSARLIVEVDGPSHRTEAQRSIDRIQTACYEALAWAVVRMEPEEVGSRAVLRARIAVAQQRRRRTPVSDAEFERLWRRLTKGLPATHVPPQGDFPSAFAHYL